MTNEVGGLEAARPSSADKWREREAWGVCIPRTDEAKGRRGWILKIANRWSTEHGVTVPELVHIRGRQARKGRQGAQWSGMHTQLWTTTEAVE